jgi:hypothetical protein
MQLQRLIETVREQLSDPRRTSHGHILYSLEAIVIIGLCTVICGGEGFEAMELIGKTRKSYFESFLELYVVWRLKQLGITAYNIYDEFFYDKPYDIASIIEEGANYMYQKIRNYDDRFNLRKRSI